MKILKKLISNIKIKFIVLAILTTIIGITTIVYITKYFSIIPKEYQFSRPDERSNEIKGKIITLKRLNHQYFQDYFKMLSPKVRKPLYFPFPHNFENVKNFLEKELSREAAGKTFLYIIFDNKDINLIGSIEIREKNPNDPGQFSCWLNEKYWGGGRIHEAIKLITKEYFKIKKVKSFNAHVEMWNLRSYYALKKAGFKLVKTYKPEYDKPRYILEYCNPNYQNQKK
ncbi:GNAT family N-acetyltransferase [Candidatus Babeliales bacterium]|nr:GNAT family N-acetyltransferase [Candidatus Babeliales bacterium]